MKILVTGGAGFVGSNLVERDALLSSSGPDVRGEVFNVGGYENATSLLELCDRWSISPSFDDWRPSDQKVFYCDISKAKRVLGWEPRMQLNEAG